MKTLTPLITSVLITSVLITSLLVIGACSSDATPQEAQKAELSVCNYDFEATVSEGTSAQLALKGTLTAVGMTDGSVLGSFRVGDNEIPLGGSANTDTLHLRFMLDGEREINGMGPLSESFASCPNEIRGELTGPADDDKGDWIGLFESSANARAQCFSDAVKSCAMQSACTKGGINSHECIICPQKVNCGAV